MAWFDKIIGLYHFLADMTPGDVPLVEPKPRRVNPWHKNGLALVSRVEAGEDIRLAIDKAITLLGSLGDVIASGDRILVKPNFNSPDPFPASTDLVFLRAVIDILLEAGTKVTIGESSGGVWRPTRKVLRKLGA